VRVRVRVRVDVCRWVFQ